LRQIIRTYQNTSDSAVSDPLAYNRNQYVYQAPTTVTYTFGNGVVSLEIRRFYFDGFDSSLFGTSEVSPQSLSKRQQQVIDQMNAQGVELTIDNMDKAMSQAGVK
jgi:hypothetical protein